jgi:hypothetical protein
MRPYIMCTLLCCTAIFGGEWTLLPSNSYLQPFTLDPQAARISASALVYEIQGPDSFDVYSPMNLGIQRILVRHDRSQALGIEFGIEFGMHSQHTITKVRNAELGGLQNIDYRIAGVWNVRNENVVYRIVLFHQSSHLGDDFIIRNGITRPTPNTLNYEELSLTRVVNGPKLQHFLGAGYNISPNTVRKRAMLQGGYFWKQPELAALRLVHGTFVRVFEETNWRPGIKTAVGLEVALDPHHPVDFLLEYYQGPLPYSTLEFQRVRLYGVGVYFSF